MHESQAQMPVGHEGTSLPPELSDLPGILAAYPEITAAYLFGSVATGHTHAESDLDIAVLPKQTQDAITRLRAKKVDILTDLVRAGLDNVDLVILDLKDIVLAHEAIRLNRVVYASEGFDRGATFSLVVRRYLDFLPYLEVQRRAYKRRVLGDST